MLQNDRRIIKVDGKNCFVEVVEAFNIDKVCLQFRTYDLTRSPGERTTNSINIYMDMQEFAYFSEIMANGDIYRIGAKHKKDAQNGYPDPAYSIMGGTANENGVVSRQLRVEIGDKKPVILKAFSGAGSKNDKGLIVPQYRFNEASEKVFIGVDMKQCTEIGLAGKRAIQIYDIWCATGQLKAKVDALHEMSENAR